MKQEVKDILKKKGYVLIIEGIDKSADDLRQAGYDADEILETLKEIFGGDRRIDHYIYIVGRRLRGKQ